MKSEFQCNLSKKVKVLYFSNNDNIANKNNDKNLAVANKDASSGAEAYMSLSLA